jgi:PKD repeat protein
MISLVLILIFISCLPISDNTISQSDQNLPPVVNLYLDPSEHNVPNAVKTMEQVYFVGKDSYDPDDTGNLTYFWDFGNGETSTLVSPINVYNQIGEYRVFLTVNDSILSSTRGMLIIVFSEGGNYPVASILLDAGKDEKGAYVANVSQPIVFDASLSYDPDGSVLNYEWDFGDGKSSMSPTPVHEYTNDDIYTIILTVHDDEELVDQDYISITIGTGTPIKPPEHPSEEDGRTQLVTIFMIIAVAIILLLILLWLFLGRMRRRTLQKTEASQEPEPRSIGFDQPRARAPSLPTSGTGSSIAAPSSGKVTSPTSLSVSKPSAAAMPSKPMPIPEFGRPNIRSQDQKARSARMNKLTANEGKLKQAMLRKKLAEQRKKMDDDMKKELQDMG